MGADEGLEAPSLRIQDEALRRGRTPRHSLGPVGLGLLRGKSLRACWAQWSQFPGTMQAQWANQRWMREGGTSPKFLCLQPPASLLQVCPDLAVEAEREDPNIDSDECAVTGAQGQVTWFFRLRKMSSESQKHCATRKKLGIYMKFKNREI